MWISVKDRLPDKPTGVIGASKYDNDGNYNVLECYFDGKNFGSPWESFDDDLYYHITHWQPLPEPPEE